MHSLAFFTHQMVESMAGDCCTRRNREPSMSLWNLLLSYRVLRWRGAQETLSLRFVWIVLEPDSWGGLSHRVDKHELCLLAVSWDRITPTVTFHWLASVCNEHITLQQWNYRDRSLRWTGNVGKTWDWSAIHGSATLPLLEGSFEISKLMAR